MGSYGFLVIANIIIDMLLRTMAKIMQVSPIIAHVMKRVGIDPEIIGKMKIKNRLKNGTTIY